MNNNIECADYFKSRKAYRRCFKEFLKKWKSYGRVAGSIILRDASEDERRAIGGMIGKVFYEKDIRFSFLEFQQGLQRTRFAPVDVREVLEAYFGENLLTNQGKKQEEQQKRAEFLQKLCRDFVRQGDESAALRWISAMTTERKYGYQLLIREYGKDQIAAEDLVKKVGSALVNLESVKERECPLAVFAAEVSGNPHYFDRGTTAGQLLIHAVAYCENAEFPKNAHQWRQLLLNVGIVPDNVSSMVHVYGLRLRLDTGWHPAYDAFCRLGEPYVLTMENLRKIAGVHAAGGRVYIVENEMVFSYLLDNMKEEKITILCTSGQIRTAAAELISLILDTDAEVYYSGDIDPEGIGIADRLWQKFGNRIHIWRMSPADYKKGISEESIGEISMSKLRHISNPELKELAEYMQEKGKAAYQENILDDLLEDIKRYVMEGKDQPHFRGISYDVSGEFPAD